MAFGNGMSDLNEYIVQLLLTPRSIPAMLIRQLPNYPKGLIFNS